jgi:hypothetical protein
MRSVQTHEGNYQGGRLNRNLTEGKNMLDEVVTHLTYIQGVLDSNLSQDTSYLQ